MDHDEVLEQIELAAAEPGGLERLMAGDTPAAAAVVGHLTGCDRCAEELRRMTRAAPLLRDLVRTTPPADLRERTLAYVREYGRPRVQTAEQAANRAQGPPKDRAVDHASPRGPAPRLRRSCWSSDRSVSSLVGRTSIDTGTR